MFGTYQANSLLKIKDGLENPASVWWKNLAGPNI
jgi:hypothetical protein